MKPSAFARRPLGPSARIFAALLLGLAAGACSTQGTSNQLQATADQGPLAPGAIPTASARAADAPGLAPLNGPCASGAVTARVTGWDGAAGSRIAAVELVNAGTAPCTLFALGQPELVDGAGSILIQGAPPAASDKLVVEPGGTLTTLVRASNYCGTTPVAPVTVAFMLPDGAGTVVAAAPSAGDTSGLPLCMGSAGSAGMVEMQPWAP